MKKIYMLFLGLCLITLAEAQVSKTLEVTSGNLSSLLTEEEKSTITSLTLIGTVDARDFIATAKMPLLTELDLSQTKVTAIDTVVDDYVAISRVDTIGSYGYNPREQNSLFSSRLKSLKLPTTIKAIDLNGIKGCSGLTSIEIPPSVISIGLYAFWGCTGLTSLTIPSNVTGIEQYSFYNCSGLKELTISPSIDRINDRSFALCSSLTELEIPSSVKNISYFAFTGCTALSTIILPASLSGIENGAFMDCPNITAIYSYNPAPPALAAGAFDTETFDGTLYVPYGSGSLYAQAEGWKDFENIVEASSGFSVSDTLLYFDIAGQSKTVDVNATMEWTAVSDQSWLTVSPSSANSSGTLTLASETNLTSAYRFATVTITPAEGEPKMIQVIQKSFPVVITLTAGNLDKILIKEELDTITSLTLTGTINANDIFTINSMLSLTTLDISQTRIVETSYDYATIPGDWIGGISISKNSMNICSGLGNSRLTTIKLPATLSVLACGAFYNCGFPSFVIPASVKTIGWEAFCGCSNLTSITIPATVTFMDQWAFSSCTGLKEVIIEEGIDYIPRGTFAGCSSLTSVTLPASMKGIELDAFNLTESLMTIYSYNPIPPSAERGFNSVDKSACIVYVPAGSGAAYAAAEGWKEFKNIVEMIPFKLSSTELSIEANSDEGSLEITTDGLWSAVCDKEWLTVSPMSGDSSQTVAFTCQENMTFESRTAMVTFSDDKGYSQTVNVTQKARINSIPSANAGKDQIVKEGETVQLDGSASTDADDDPLTYKWAASEGITLNSEDDEHPSFLAPKVEKDTVYTINLVVNDGKVNSASDQVLITVQNKTVELALSADSVVFESKESSADITITTNAQWNALSDQDWLTVSPLSGEGQKKITLTAKANDTYNERMAIVTVSAPEAADQTISVTQQGLVTGAYHIKRPLAISCYPNPFTAQMTIEIENPSLKKTTVEIFSMSGQKIKTLLRAQKGAKINCTWNGRDESGKQLPGGMYLLKVNGEIRKVVKR